MINALQAKTIATVVAIMLMAFRTSVANAEERYDIQVPDGWTIERELFGLDRVLLGPFVNTSRPAMSITYLAASIKKEQLDRLSARSEELIKEKRRYVAERRGTIVSAEPPRRLRHPRKYDVLVANFVYDLKSTEIAESIYLVNCPQGLYHLKAVTRVSPRLRKDQVEFAKIVDSFSCNY